MNMRIHFVIHESFEGPGAIADWARQRKHEVSYSRVFIGEALPVATKSFDFLIVMGGPQSPTTTKKECPHFDAQAEMELIRMAVKEGKVVLGVCLGAQLLGDALGAIHDRSPEREIGVYDIRLTEAAKSDPIFSDFPESFAVAHWHGDMPGLTEQAAVLAYSQGCPRQIIRYAPNVYGFQCHLEFTAQTIEAIVSECSHELSKYRDAKFVQSADALRAHRFEDINQYLFRFLDRIATQSAGKSDS